MSIIHWLEIPVTDIERAQKFYAAVLDTEIPVMDMTAEMGSMLGLLPNGGGALVQNSQYGYEPSEKGTLVYLAMGDEDLDKVLKRVESAGGQVLLSKTAMGENGFSAWILDSEGNKIGFHSFK